MKRRTSDSRLHQTTDIKIPGGGHQFVRPVWVGLGVAALLLLLWASDVLIQTRLRLSNVLFVPRATSGEVVIIAADKPSLDIYGERSVSSWPRSLHAQLVDIVSAGGARVIAFDLLFHQASPEDELFIDAVNHARTETEARTRVVLPLVGAQRESETDQANLIGYRDVLAPTDAIAGTAVALGHTNAFPDADGAVRWQPTRIRFGEDTTLAFGIVTYLSYLRIPSSAFDQVVEYHPDMIILANSRRVPVDEVGRMLINYWGAPGEGAFPTYSFRDVIGGEVDPAVFNDKIVLVGLMNHITPDDTYQVPIGLQGGQMAGVEIHANIVETLIQNAPLRPQNDISQVILIIVLALLSSMVYQYVRRYWYVIVGAMLGLGFLWFLSAFVVFNVRHQMIDLLHPLLALILPAPLIIVLHARQEVQRRQQAELLLGSIVTASSQRLSLASILPGIANDMQRILNCAAVEYWLWDGVGKRFKTMYTASEIDPLHEGLALRALQANHRLSAQHRLAVPLTWQGEPLGVLIAVDPERLTRATTNLLDLFTWQTASIVANAVQHQEIQNLSELKTRMIRMASHDLKNPLTVIQGYLHLMRDEYEHNNVLPRHHVNFMNMMDSASEMMLTIINNILDLERVRRGVLTVQGFNLLDTLQYAIEHNQGAIEQNRHVFTAELPDEFPLMVGDELQLREAFSNLLNNATKYTPEGGHIWLRLKQIDDRAHIEIQDDGLGIAQEDQENLFQEFYRVRTLETADIDGTGLGLSLVKAVVEAHAGRVWVESEAGQGSTFFVELTIPHLDDIPDA